MSYLRLALLVSFFITPIGHGADPKWKSFSIRGTYPDGSGGHYVVVNVSSDDSRTGGHFPILIRTDASGQIDTTYGKGGAVSFRNLDGWPMVEINDIKINSEGKPIILGTIESPPPLGPTFPSPNDHERRIDETRRKLRDIEQSLQAEDQKIEQPEAAMAKKATELALLNVLSRDFVLARNPKEIEARMRKTFERRKLATVKVFLAKLEPTGKLDTKFGESGLSIHSVLDRSGDSAMSLKIAPDDSMIYLAQKPIKPDEGGNVPLLGKVKKDGSADTSFGTKGMVTWEPKDIPLEAGKSYWQFSSVGLTSSGDIAIHADVMRYEPKIRTSASTLEVSADGKRVGELVPTVKVGMRNWNPGKLPNIKWLVDSENQRAWAIFNGEPTGARVRILQYKLDNAGKPTRTGETNSTALNVLDSTLILEVEPNADGGLTLRMKDPGEPRDAKLVHLSADLKSAKLVGRIEGLFRPVLLRGIPGKDDCSESWGAVCKACLDK